MSQRASIELETDRREPHPSTLGKRAIALGVEPIELLEDLSSADVISNGLSKHLSSGYHNRYHNPVATPGISRQLKASYLRRFSLGAPNGNQRRSTVKNGTCLKIMVFPVRVQGPSLMFSRVLHGHGFPRRTLRDCQK